MKAPLNLSHTVRHWEEIIIQPYNYDFVFLVFLLFCLFCFILFILRLVKFLWIV